MKYKRGVWLIAVSVFFFCHADGQLMNNSGAVIQVSGVDLFIGGGVVNNGTIINNGIITVAGDWSNGGKYTSATGTFALNGDVTQQITHHGDSIYTLSLSGGGDKVVLDEVLVAHDLQFKSPVLLKTSAIGAIVIHDGATITGADNTAYVEGVLYHEGVGKKMFPIGVNGRYLPVTLEKITSEISEPITGISLSEPNAGALADASLLSVSTVRYGQILQKQGNPVNSLISVSIGDDEVQTIASDMVVAEADTPAGPYRSLGQSAIAINTTPPLITSGVAIAGGYFAIGTKDSGRGSDGVYVPSAFSILATSAEDKVIKVYGDLVSPNDFEFRVFSNWGNIIFESRSLVEMQTVGWKGYDRSGELVSIGTYTYSLQGKLINGKSFEKSGSLTFIK
jgi:hypothetical protein